MTARKPAAKPAATPPADTKPAAAKAAAAKTEPPAEPYATVEAIAYPKTFYRPAVKICTPTPDGGETVEIIDHCDHMDKYGHSTEAAALACFRRIANQRGLKIR